MIRSEDVSKCYRGDEQYGTRVTGRLDEVGHASKRG